MARAPGLGRLVLLGNLVLASCEGALAERPRHVLLVTIDTLRADHLSCHGYGRPTTAAHAAAERGSSPGFTIDDLASQGTRFTRAFAPRGETFPSIATLFTGRPPIETCALGNEDTLPSRAETLAEILGARGYRTAAFTTNRLLVSGSGIEQGFDRFESDASPEKDERMAAAAATWLAEQDLRDGPPVFLWLHLVGPHLPYEPRPLDGIDFAVLFTDPRYAGIADGSREITDRAHAGQVELGPADTAQLVALYDGEIARIDHVVSRFLAACAREEGPGGGGFLDDALLVLTADHGEEILERNRYTGHAKSVYGSVLHVPLVFRHPATVAEGRRIDDVVGLEDVLPTVLELLRIDAHTSVRGRSLVHVLRGGLADPRPAFGAWADRVFTVRSSRWRLVWNPGRIEPTGHPPGSYPIPEVALFDVEADPRETTDLSGSHPGTVAELQGRIRTWLGGLVPCDRGKVDPTEDRMRALREMGYAGEDR